MTEFIHTERTAGGVEILTLNRPAKRNALNYGMADEIIDAFTRCNVDERCRAIVMTGAGNKAFCAGMDLSVTEQFDGAAAADWMNRLRALYTAIRSFDKPHVAAVNEIAAGAGYQLALLADVRVGHPATRMSQPEINVGMPSLIGAQLMLPMLGLSRTTELTLTGRVMDADETARLGLISRMAKVGTLMEESLTLAEELASKPPTAFRLTKKRFRDITQPDLEAAFEDAAKIQQEAFATGEPQRVIQQYFSTRRARSE